MKSDDKRFLELGKQVAVVLDTAGVSRKRMMINSFLKGLSAGFGAVIGGTILIALLLWVLGLLNQVPFLSQATDTVRDTIQTK